MSAERLLYAEKYRHVDAGQIHSHFRHDFQVLTIIH